MPKYRLHNGRLQRTLSVTQLEDRVNPASLWTDLPDYAPGSTACISGSGYGVGETIDLEVTLADGTPQGSPDNPWSVVDGGEGDLDGVADGNFTTTWYVDPTFATDQALRASATGQLSGETAEAFFTDAGAVGLLAAPTGPTPTGTPYNNTHWAVLDGATIQGSILGASDAFVVNGTVQVLIKSSEHGNTQLTGTFDANGADNIAGNSDDNAINFSWLVQAPDGSDICDTTIVAYEIKVSQGKGNFTGRFDNAQPDLIPGHTGNTAGYAIVNADGSPHECDDDGSNDGNGNVAPVINVLKSPNPGSVFEGGVGIQTVTYTYEVTNTSPAGANDPLHDVTISDTDGTPTRVFAGKSDDGDLLLEVGETWYYSLTKTMIPQNVGASHSNTVTVSGYDDEDTLATDDDTATVSYTNVDPVIKVVKSADVTSVSEGGVGNQTVVYTYLVTNESSASTDDELSGVTVTDPDGTLTFVGGDTDNDGKLDFGETWVYTLSLPLAAANAGATHTNTATAGGTDDEGNTATDTDTATVTYTDVAPQITVTKTGPTSANVGSNVTFSYTVRNTSPASTDDELSGVGLSDTDGTPSYVDGDTDNDGKLDFGETWVYTLTVPMPASGTTYTNTVTATGTDDELGTDTDTATHTLTLTFTVKGTKYQDRNGNGFGPTNTAPTTTFAINLFKDDGDGVLDVDDTLVQSTSTAANGTYAFAGLYSGFTYFVAEGLAATDAANWLQTDGGNGGNSYYTHAMAVSQDISGDNFANVHLGRNQGLTIGYYSNKNGQKTITADDLAYLRTLNLRNANGSDFDPTTAAQVATFLTNANAVNMANMLSAQLIATVLNVRHGLVTSAAVYVGPGNQMGAFNTQGSNLLTNLNSKGPISSGAGFVDIGMLIARANAELALFGVSTAAVNPGERLYMEAMKNIFDAINNNTNIFVL